MRREQRPLESKTEQWDPISGAQNLSRSLFPCCLCSRGISLIRARETERKHRRAGEFVC